LDVSRIRQGKIELRMERLDLVLAVNQAVDDVRPQFEAMHHELTVAVPSQPLYLDADPTRLAQVLDNLLNNACKYTNRGGHISITAERDGLMAIVRVRDDGIGIKAEHLGSIFDLFVQVDTSPEFSGSGLGLGLTLVKNLVELHGGTVEGRSAGEGKGSEFIVRLPVAAQTPDSVTAPDGIEPNTQSHRRILIVDDNVDSAASMAMLLELSGYETSMAHDGLEGLAAAERLRPDIMLLDLGLPNLNGYETARRIREQPWGKSVVLIAVTGWNQDSARRQSREAGFDEHLVKPVDHAMLLKVLARTSPSSPPPA
jgi:CheY-like chemotaxis protein/two-component sensor histidine kinase